MATIQSSTTKLIPGASRHNGVKGGKALKRTAGEGGRGGRAPLKPPKAKAMLQQSTAALNGHAGKHSRANGHAVILGTPCAIGRQVEPVEDNGVSAPEERRL